MAVRSYRDLLAWQEAMRLVTEVYEVTRSFPREGIYGLTGQIGRAAVSVPSNIAEGQGPRSTGEFVQFVGHARGSLFELVTQIQIAPNLGYLDDGSASALLDQSGRVGRLLNGLLASLGR